MIDGGRQDKSGNNQGNGSKMKRLNGSKLEPDTLDTMDEERQTMQALYK